VAEDARRPRDPAKLRPRLVEWLKAQVEASGLAGAVFGVSGGVDSAVVCGLAAEALGPDRCLGLILPIESAAEDERLAGEVTDRFGVASLRVDLERPFLTVIDTLADYQESASRLRRGVAQLPRMPGSPAALETSDAAAVARTNLKPRLRALTLYYFANLLGYLVVGTSNRDERAVGYFTKWGDSAADVFPLGDLLKAEVRGLALELGVPDEIVRRTPTAGLYPGQTDEGDLGFSYDALDRYLLTGSSGDSAVDERIRERVRSARHKLQAPPLAHPD
jgi:NAD+ synthase